MTVNKEDVIKTHKNKQAMKKDNKPLKKEAYISPDIKVVEVEIEQNILAGGSGDLPGFGGEDW